MKISQALTDDLDVIIVLEKPADRRAFDGPGAGQVKNRFPSQKRLHAVSQASGE